MLGSHSCSKWNRSNLELPLPIRDSFDWRMDHLGLLWPCFPPFTWRRLLFLLLCKKIIRPTRPCLSLPCLCRLRAMGSQWCSAIVADLLLQRCESWNRSIQNYRSVCSIKHACIYSTRNFNYFGCTLVYILAFFGYFHIFCWYTWAKVGLWIYYWGQMEQNNSLCFRLLNVCSFLG